MLARKRGATITLNALQSTSNKGISFVPFNSASNNDFKIRRGAAETVDGRNEGADSIGERLKEGAMETGLNVGGKAKQSMEEAWDAAKETTENVKDAVIDDANDEMEKGYEYPPTHKDKHTQNLRKRADGYDLRDHD